jgi:hypothetical protein
LSLRMRLLLFVTVGVAGAIACADPDPNFGEPAGIIGRKLPKEGETPGAPGPGGGPTSAFPKPYAAADNKPTTTLKAAHDAKGGPAPDTIAQPCLDCHKTGGQAAAKVFSFGGRIAGKKPDIDVIVGGGTPLGPTKTDADGFYWFVGGAVADGSRPVVRSATEESAMLTALTSTTGGSCDGTAACHGGGQGPAGGGL